MGSVISCRADGSRQRPAARDASRPSGWGRGISRTWGHHSLWVDRHGEGVSDLSMIVSLSMPRVVTIATTVVLLLTVA